jgi:uncharacterized protein DUF5681
MANTSDEDGVGYKRPPHRTRFVSGKSGNPKGRAKHLRNFKTDLRDELCQMITVREGGREMKISKQRAFVKALVAAAIKGDTRATNALVSFCARAFGGDDQDDQRTSPPADDLEILEAFITRELKRRASEDGDVAASPNSTNDRSIPDET